MSNYTENEDTENEDIEKAIEHLVSVLRENAPKNTITFSLFINSNEQEVRMRSMTPEQLKSRGISTRNLRGDFIE